MPIPAAPGFFVWSGGEPTASDIEHAPPFTVFVGADVEFDGPLPSVAMDAISGDPAFFISERDDIPYTDEVAEILHSSRLPWALSPPGPPRLGPLDPGEEYSLGHHPDLNDELSGEDVKVDGRRFKLEWYQPELWAIRVGYTLLIVPDALTGHESRQRMHYVIDSLRGHQWWRTPFHTDLAALARGGAPAAGPSEDLAIINRHRRKLGMKALDPVAAGWTKDDVRIEAAELRRRGANPRASLLSWGGGVSCRR